MTSGAPGESELITGIAELTTNEDDRPVRHGAAIVVENGTVAWIGDATDAPAADRNIDIGGRALLPGWVDAHTHPVFAGERSVEFEARMAGIPYGAGGIMQTVAATRRASDAELLERATKLRAEALAQGTTFFEAKTGYGLTLDDELRCARVASQIADTVTFLGAHVVPDGENRRDYLDLVTGPMLDAVADWVQYVDVFCEVGAFSVDESREVLLSALSHGLGTRVHGNQLGHSGGVQLAVEFACASVDHCNYLDESDISALAESGTVATLLPACDISTRQPFAPARRLLDAGASIALATNCNPGSSYTTSMPFCVATAVTQMGLSVREAVFAATRGGARAVGREEGPGAVGRVRVGDRADIQVLDAPSVAHLAYRIGTPISTLVWLAGELQSSPTGLDVLPREVG